MLLHTIIVLKWYALNSLDSRTTDGPCSGRTRDIKHYILSFLANTLNPHSYQLKIDTRTLQRLCLVSCSFNAAANAVLYSSIAVSELTMLSLTATARTNPALFRHCHSLWFQSPLYCWHFITLGNIVHIISCCPNLRRVHRAGLIQMSMFDSHLPQLTNSNRRGRVCAGDCDHRHAHHAKANHLGAYFYHR
jgi:hypothetical protein